MKRFLAIVSAMLILCFGLSACGTPDEQNTPTDKPTEETQIPEETQIQGDMDMNEKLIATIEMEDGGIIKIELYPDIAPQSVYNFVSLARSGFYDGTTFHRIIPGFMIQGGDPTGTGTGHPGYSIKGEFSANGFTNDLKHTRGVISMARSTPYDSAGCQFFIMHADAPHLDGLYAAFGKVIEGMDVVDQIANVKCDPKNNHPYTEVVIKSITIEGPELPEPNKLAR